MTDRPEIAHLGHTTLTTPNMEKSLWFFRDLLGMEVVEEVGDAVYLRAYQELEHHSLILKEDSEARLVNFALRTKQPEHVEDFARQLHNAGVEITEVTGGTVAGQGDSIRFFLPHSHHPIEIYYDITKPKAPESIRTLLPSNSSTRRGIGVRRLDHVNVQTSRETTGAAEQFLREQLGFKRREAYINDDGTLNASWASVTNQTHDVAIVSNGTGKLAQLHHVAFNVENYHDSMVAAEVFRDAEIQIDRGPGKHGVGQALFLYVREPGSNHRIEIYTGGNWILAPDWEPVHWYPKDFSTGLTWYGEPVVPSPESKMRHTTPSVETLV